MTPKVLLQAFYKRGKYVAQPDTMADGAKAIEKLLQSK